MVCEYSLFLADHYKKKETFLLNLHIRHHSLHFIPHSSSFMDLSDLYTQENITTPAVFFESRPLAFCRLCLNCIFVNGIPCVHLFLCVV